MLQPRPKLASEEAPPAPENASSEDPCVCVQHELYVHTCYHRSVLPNLDVASLFPLFALSDCLKFKLVCWYSLPTALFCCLSAPVLAAQLIPQFHRSTFNL